MPMVLRSRKSIQTSEKQSRDTTLSTPRRSTRLHGTITYEDSDESESVSSELMESHQNPLAALEEEGAEETEELKLCSVVLDRLGVDDKAAKGELEEREDMNRKGGKAVSRIPTFHKRPTNASQSTELPVSKIDTPTHIVQPLKKAASRSNEDSMSDGRDKGLPLPSVRIPKIGFEAASLFSSPEQGTAAVPCAQITAPKGWTLSESVQQSILAVSPRPALRAGQEMEEHLAEQDKSKNSDNVTDGPISHLPCEVPVSHKPQEYTPQRFDIEGTATGDTTKSESAEIPHTPEVSQVEDIMNEEPPWETEPTNRLELRDSKSSSDVDCEDDLEVAKPDGDSGEVKELYETHVHQSEHKDVLETQASADELTPHEAPQKTTKAAQSKKSGFSSFALFCFLPTTLLLLGGFGQHVWHYGLPMSVAQLTAQMELHWLEGVGLVAEPCSVDCRVHLVESIPVGLYPSTPSALRSTADSWLSLLDKANSSVHIAAVYLTLRGSDVEFPDSTDSQGRRIFAQLKQLESKGVKLQIAVNANKTSTQDTDELAAAGADVREVNLKALTGGIVHTKLWVVDQKHLYLGSANMDWRSLSQVKEVGLSVEDCSCLAQDAFRIFGVYWSIGGVTNGSLPPYWPARFSAMSSSQQPLHVKFNGVPAKIYLSSAPPQISARGRSDDLTTILSVIDDAQKFILISVMDYLPLSEFTEPLRFWPSIDSALRAAACTRQVSVRLLVSCWQHSPGSMFPFLQSLLVLNRPPLNCDIEVNIFTVPSTAEQRKIPFARVNHAKYMVTDRVVYIGTSNWSESYFTQTAGVGLVVNQTGSVVGIGQQTLQSQAEELFLRDWRSDYARSLLDDEMDVCPH